MHERPEAIAEEGNEEQSGYAPADEADDEAEQDQPEEGDLGEE